MSVWNNIYTKSFLRNLDQIPVEGNIHKTNKRSKGGL